MTDTTTFTVPCSPGYGTNAVTVQVQNRLLTERPEHVAEFALDCVTVASDTVGMFTGPISLNFADAVILMDSDLPRRFVIHPKRDSELRNVRLHAEWTMQTNPDFPQQTDAVLVVTGN